MPGFLPVSLPLPLSSTLNSSPSAVPSATLPVGKAASPLDKPASNGLPCIKLLAADIAAPVPAAPAACLAPLANLSPSVGLFA